ncbi:ATP-binding cassette domain-containing protein [Paenibacillus sp. TAB 01]|uniref:ATP-binding cassette domain-containing protein n=1 Tax=Paenibacillus sp. TAB 01 TaxID=3368988 RepID=UPI0037508138
MTIRENMTLPVLSRFASSLSVRHGAEKSAVAAKMEELQVKATGTEQPVQQLSGGNQQKVVFAKALLSQPKVFLCDEPTQAVDVMTREEIHRLLRRQAEQGCGVVFVSSDLQEVLDIADRIVVMREGRTVAELPNADISAEQVLSLCYNQLH